MAALRKKGQTIHSEAREVIRKVIKECDEEANSRTLKYAITQRNLRIANYCGISERSVTQIRKEGSEAEESSLSTPGKKRPRSEEHKFHCDDFDRRVIRDLINDFYIYQKKVPTAPKLLSAVKEKINFPWKVDTLRKLLHGMGFKWKKCASRRKILIERPDIVNWRGKYLRTIKKYRDEERTIVYIDESWVDNNLTFGKCWQSDEVCGVTTNTSSSNRLILVNAGSQDGFVPGASLIFRAGLASGDYHGQMNGENFEKWMVERLFPNIPHNSVIVLDNAPYHSIQENKPPSKYAVKQAMMKWLEDNNIPFSADMKKFQLFELIQHFKPAEKKFHIDRIIESHGHTALRLPPYMCELNAIELAWAAVKRYVREHNVSGDLSLTKLQQVTDSAVNTITKANWEGYINHVKKLEAEYWENDGLMEDAIDNIIITVGGLESSDEESETESEESESELARPLSD